MKKLIGLIVYVTLLSTQAWSKPPDIFLGNWTYRSFIANLDFNTEFNALQFGQGTIQIKNISEDGTFTGQLVMHELYILKLTGKIQEDGDGFRIAFRGEGMTDATRGWIYDYEAHTGKVWPNGVGQVPSLTGTLIRVVPHGSGKAGFVANLIALKQ